MTAPSILFTNAGLLDPETGSRHPDSWLLVTNGTIAAHGQDTPPDADATVIDLAGATLMPGLVDAHVHPTAISADLGFVSEQSPYYVGIRAAQALTGMLHRGFTTVRDVAGGDFGLADAIAEGTISGPRLMFGGKALSPTGGHGDFRTRGRHAADDHPCCPTLGVRCDGAAEARRAARDQLRTGAHHIKIMLSGGVASPTDRIDSVQTAEEEVRAIVEEAELANRYVTGHSYTARAVNRGLRLGVRCIEHGNLIDETSIELFREHDAFLVPTLATYHELSRRGPESGLPPASQAKIDTVLHSGLHALRMAHEGGVNLVYGTDLLGDMQTQQNEEFRIRAQVQPAADILRAATSTAARLLNLEGHIGTIQPGACADLVVVDGNPLDDVTILADHEQHLRMVLTEGQIQLDRRNTPARAAA
ncbi:amidohydrolase family protein [Lipingzhangella sp. LS1_29]|uniref:Amidohydrolase family protein n=1 Tax=Lipingzhangella rawalii TaxID=2055835 RepID=A0ABU2H152_9ACTN|nr:amidohydrolase family protein [Lipingzhangella rawalii]MDS1269037.1 amidohydrolase family protein [Lipingzhangella rawalii]